MGHKWNPKIKNGWFMVENLFKMDDLGVPPFQEPPIYLYHTQRIIALGCSLQSKPAVAWPRVKAPAAMPFDVTTYFDVTK